MGNGKYNVVDIPPKPQFTGKWGELYTQIINLPEGKAIEIEDAKALPRIRIMAANDKRSLYTRKVDGKVFAWSQLRNK